MAEIRWSLKAEGDLRSIEDFIARDSALRAVSLVNRLVKAAESLEVAPNLGRVVPEFAQERVREIVCRGYRLVYLVEQDIVTVLRVVHGARDFGLLARREPWDFS